MRGMQFKHDGLGLPAVTARRQMRGMQPKHDPLIRTNRPLSRRPRYRLSPPHPPTHPRSPQAKGETLLHNAVARSQTGLVRALLGAKANPDTPSKVRGRGVRGD